jgi:RNA polymerase sigma factor (sigma-70 family)
MKQELSAIPVMESINGDQSYFGQLTLVDKNKVFKYIRRHICDFTLAEDILQDTLIKVFQSVKSGKYFESGKFIGWVMRIAHNLIIDHFRLVNQMNTISKDNYEPDLFNSIKFAEDNVQDYLIKRERHQNVRKMISRLPEDQKEVVILKHFKGLSFKEISAITNVSINTSLGRMRYALLNLRKMME